MYRVRFKECLQIVYSYVWGYVVISNCDVIHWAEPLVKKYLELFLLFSDILSCMAFNGAAASILEQSKIVIVEVSLWFHPFHTHYSQHVSIFSNYFFHNMFNIAHNIVDTARKNISFILKSKLG